jgi:uncharacterized protein (TIGR03437 family)
MKTATLLFAAALAFAQPSLPPIVLEVDVNNLVFYGVDSSEFSRLASNPASTTTTAPNFRSSVSIGDITAINGRPAKGVYISRLWTITLTPNPAPGQAMADVTRSAAYDGTIEILQADGTAIGSVMFAGLAGGPAAPGSPAAFVGGWNSAVTGGTGYFLGARGSAGVVSTPVPVRNASITEDPANRRIHGGGTRKYVVSVIPMVRPEIVNDSMGPVIYHAADFSRVTAGNPARAGETLIAMASGLGPTTPAFEPGRAFANDSRNVPNAPVEVAIGGRMGEVVNQVGWPGLLDRYRVDFRVPAETAAGVVSVRLTAAWIPGPEASFPVR